MPEQLGAGHVRLQDAAVEGDHEVADRGQQVEFVEVRLFLLVAQPIGADAAVELLLPAARPACRLCPSHPTMQ
jgi:hypothetical protein